MEFSEQAFGIVPPKKQFELNLNAIIDLLKERVRRRMDSEEPQYRELRRGLLESPLLATQGREFLVKHRSLQDFWVKTASNFPSYSEREALIDEAFGSTFDILDGITSGRIFVDVDSDVLNSLDMTEANRLWDRAKKRLADDGDLEGAITLTRTLLESVCKKILNTFGEEYGGADKAQSLCKRALAHVMPRGISGNEHFQHFIRSTLNIVEHVALFRGEQGDAHGTPESKSIAARQAAYVVNLAGATALFLVESYKEHIDGLP